MNIQPIQYNNISMQGNPNSNWNKLKHRVVQKILDTTPEVTAKESARKLEKMKKVDEIISKPAENRGIMGLTALITQPAIDSCNHKVDEDTRRVSINRTIAKIIAGTCVGMFVVRGPIYKGIEKMTDIKGSSKYSKALIPKKCFNELYNNPKFLKNYRSALSMGVALLAMCVTNFVLDAPLTIFLTNLLNKKNNKTEEVKNG